MSEYTAAASRPGQKAGAGDDRALFLREFGGLVLTAYLEIVKQYDSLRWVKHITQGKSDTFPVIGKKRDASEHEPGEEIKGGKILHDEIEVTLDKMVYDSVFIPEIDELMLHYELRGPYATQLGQSLGSLQAKRIAIMHILASRSTAVLDMPTPSYAFAANMRTSATAIETAYFAAEEFLRTNDISGAAVEGRLPWQQYLLCARNLGLDPTRDVAREGAGSGNRVTATLGKIANIDTMGTNYIPKGVVASGPTKYQGDFTNVVGHIGNRMAVASLERKAMQITTKDQAERLGTIMIASQLNGHGILRGECSFELATVTR